MRNWLVRLLVAVGLARLVGFYSGFFPLSVLGEQFGASPLPLVFSDVKDVETYRRRFQVRLRLRDSAEDLVWNGRGFCRSLRGPFSRVKTYVEPLAFADLSSGRRRSEVVRATFCGDTVVTRELGLERPVDKILLVLLDSGDPTSADKVYEVSCVP